MSRRLGRRRWLVSCCLLLLGGAWPDSLVAQPVTDAEIKATLLFKFVPFVRWPKQPRGEAFTFLIVGDDPFGEALDHYQEQMVGGRPLKIVRISEPTALPDCDMLYISRSVDPELETLLADIRHKPVLTVSDQPGWGQRGVMINFYESDETVRFEINTVTSRAAGLKIGAQLLKLSRIVKGR